MNDPANGPASHGVITDLVGLLGLEEAQIDVAHDGVTVRVRRQLVAPRDVAWQRLVGDDPQPTAGAVPPPGFDMDGFAPGPMSSVEPGRRVSYDLPESAPDGSRAVWELSDDLGTGHDARLVLALHTGPADDDVVVQARTALPRHVGRLAAALVSAAVGGSGED